MQEYDGVIIRDLIEVRDNAFLILNVKAVKAVCSHAIQFQFQIKAVMELLYSCWKNCRCSSGIIVRILIKSFVREMEPEGKWKWKWKENWKGKLPG